MPKEFTDEEFEATDTLISDQYDKESAMLNMRDIHYAVSHSHENESIVLSIRYAESYFTPDGVSEERPRQISIPIPVHYWHGIMLEAMVNIGCIVSATEKEDGE